MDAVPTDAERAKKLLQYVTYLLYATGTMPARYCAMWRKAGSAMSKCGLGGLHQPPSSLGRP
jgi:hypothetical protein